MNWVKFEIIVVPWAVLSTIDGRIIVISHVVTRRTSSMETEMVIKLYRCIELYCLLTTNCYCNCTLLTAPKGSENCTNTQEHEKQTKANIY